MRDESLEQLLMLGELEAVVTAVCAPGLTDKLARRAWWAMEDAENARHMLSNPAVIAGRGGRALARYLLEFFPFETETEKMMVSARFITPAGADRRGGAVIPVEEIRLQTGLSGGFPPGPAG